VCFVQVFNGSSLLKVVVSLLRFRKPHHVENVVLLEKENSISLQF
jgi:hypothetical protein